MPHCRKGTMRHLLGLEINVGIVIRLQKVLTVFINWCMI